MMRRFFMGLACVFGLTGCAALNFGAEQPPARQVALLGGAVLVAGPPGYCVDVSNSQLLRGFALLAPCKALGVEDPGAPIGPGLLTVQAGRLGTALVEGSEPAMAGFLETADGAALLSDAPGGVNVISTDLGQNKVSVQFEDVDGSPIAGTSDVAWRGFFDVGGRLVTISARGLAAGPLDDETGTALLDAAIQALVAANAAES